MLETEPAHAVRADSCILDGEIVALAPDGRSRVYDLPFRREWPHFIAFGVRMGSNRRAIGSSAALTGTSLWSIVGVRRGSLFQERKMLRRICLATILLATAACRTSNLTPPSPSAPTATPTSATFSLTGQVTDATTSRPIGGAAVAIADGPNAGKSTTTSSSGSYSFTGLPPSGFTVRVEASGYVSVSQPVTLTANLTVNFALRAPPAPEFVLTGHVVDASTLAPLSGAVVSINGRYRATTSDSGSYTDVGFLDYGGNHDFTYVSAINHFSDYHYIRGTTQDVRVYPIERIAAGESKSLTIAPADSLCVNNVQDTPGLGPDYVCRSVRIVVPRDGVLTVEAVSTVPGGARPSLEVETVGVIPCCSERLENPTSLRVSPGTEVVTNVEMLASGASQSFVVKTSFVPQ